MSDWKGKNMRNRSLCLIVMILFFYSLCGCEYIKNQSAAKVGKISISDQGSNSSQKEKSTDLIKETTKDPRKDKIKMVTKLSDYVLDLDGDGVEEKIELHTTAEKDKDGSILWDDGQNWLLVVVDGNKFYPLFEQYVQLGTVYFNVFEDENSKLRINLIVATATNINLVNYTYDGEQKGYTAGNIYDSGDIELKFSSVPNY